MLWYAVAGEHSLLIFGSCGCAVQLDRGLPDYVVAADAFDVRRRHAWTPGSRFRMYFGGKKARVRAWQLVHRIVGGVRCRLSHWF
jgi:hypothetical protein